MPHQEEVNAWASYEQTARAPRRLSTVALRHRTSVAASNTGGPSASLHIPVNLRESTNRRSLSQSCHPSIDLAAISAEFPKRRSSPLSGATRRSSFFQDVLSAELGRSPIDEKDTEGAATKLADLNLDVLDNIRATFNVFFAEGTAEEVNKPNNLVKLVKSLNATMPWIQTATQSPILLFLDLCLRGVGQVYFQNSPLTGLFILIGLFIQSTRVAIHGALALVVTNAVALVLGFDKGLAGSGLFGYNAVLVGLALATFDSHQAYSASTLLGTVVISSFTSILFVTMGKLLVPYKSPPLTLPFNVATMLFLLSVAYQGRFDYGSVRLPSLPDYQDDNNDFSITASQFFAGTIRGLGQVFLADHLAAGFLVLIGIAVCSRISAAAALVGSAMGAAVAVATGVPALAVETGMYGFNSSLSVTAMFMFYSPSMGAGILAIMAGVVTVIAQQALATMLQPWGLPFMTLPFCVVTLPFIVIQGTTSIVIAVPLASMTVPEDHLRTVKILTDGFAFLKEALVEPSTNNSTLSSQRMRSRKLTKSLSLLSEAFNEVDEAQSGNITKAKGTTKELRKQEKTKEEAVEIFQALLSGQDDGVREVPLSHITEAFQAAGLNDMEALNFASLILALIDLDDSASLSKAEFVCFALVCRAVYTIRTKIVQFIDFVDQDGNGSVSFDEVDAALEYLGQPVLDEISRERLLQLTQSTQGCFVVNENEEDKDEIEVSTLVNCVTVAKVKAFTSAFHGRDAATSQTSYGISRDQPKDSKEIKTDGITEDPSDSAQAHIDC